MINNSIRIVAIIAAYICFSQAGKAETDHDVAKRLRDSEKILPLEQILEQYLKQYPGRLQEAELESEHDQYIYELQILDRQGRIWKLNIDAMTGALLTTNNDD